MELPHRQTYGAKQAEKIYNFVFIDSHAEMIMPTLRRISLFLSAFSPRR